MEIGFILLAVLVCACALAAVLLCYMEIYKRHINKSLNEPTQRRGRMVPPWIFAILIPVFLVITGICAFCLDLVFDLNNSRLTTKEEILENACIGYEDFHSQISMTENVAAVLMYPEDLSEAEFRIYINQNSNYPNYVFRSGGGVTSIERAICLWEHHGSFILLSLNAPHIAEIRCENGTTYAIDPNAPFALVIPDAGSLLSASHKAAYFYDYTGIEFYDEDRQVIDLTTLDWFEMRRIS